MFLVTLKLNILLILAVFVLNQFAPWAIWYFSILYWFHNSGIYMYHELEVPRGGKGTAEQKGWLSQILAN